jgi:YVTN family beta-propeller protein
LQAYVANRCSLSVIDTVTNEAARIAVGDLPRCVGVSPDGKAAYISNFGDGSIVLVVRALSDQPDVSTVALGIGRKVGNGIAVKPGNSVDRGATRVDHRDPATTTAAIDCW